MNVSFDMGVLVIFCAICEEFLAMVRETGECCTRVQSLDYCIGIVYDMCIPFS
jgi:hypothetical protein